MPSKIGSLSSCVQKPHQQNSENRELLWKQTGKERRVSISSSCPGDDEEPQNRLIRTFLESSGIERLPQEIPFLNLSSRRLGGMEKTLTEQIKFRPAIPLPLDQFKARALAFRLPL